METHTEKQIVVSNLVTVDFYAKNVVKKSRRTVYNWINDGKLEMIDFLGKKWLDKTVFKKD